MVLIWSFHLKYCQPASFYLKAPTMLYVFIFIALSALRFELRWVLLAGLVAAAGWGALIVYVIHVDPADTMITTNYVDYLTSNSILLGAEFDKIVSILVVTGDPRGGAAARLGPAGARGRGADGGPGPVPFLRPRGRRADQGLRPGDHAGSGELREAAILNLDMRGFTKLAETCQPTGSWACWRSTSP